MEIRPKKRIFIGLLVFTSIILLFLIFLLWYVPIIGLGHIHPSLPLFYSLGVGLIILLIFLGGLLLIFTVIWRRDIFLSHKLRGIVAKILFPFMIQMGKLVGVSKEKVQQSFIELNNHLVRSNNHKIQPEKILILLPHCIQNYECDVKITSNIKNCRRCGRCEIKDLIELADYYHSKIAVATGGTLARRIIVENKPEAIVAVACELDLTTGIQDSYPIPVIGILNDRPNGPCINTKVDIKKVKDAVLYFIGP